MTPHYFRVFGRCMVMGLALAAGMRTGDLMAQAAPVPGQSASEAAPLKMWFTLLKDGKPVRIENIREAIESCVIFSVSNSNDNFTVRFIMKEAAFARPFVSLAMGANRYSKGKDVGFAGMGLPSRQVTIPNVNKDDASALAKLLDVEPVLRREPSGTLEVRVAMEALIVNGDEKLTCRFKIKNHGTEAVTLQFVTDLAKAKATSSDLLFIPKDGASSRAVVGFPIGAVPAETLKDGRLHLDAGAESELTYLAGSLNTAKKIVSKTWLVLLRLRQVGNIYPNIPDWVEWEEYKGELATGIRVMPPAENKEEVLSGNGQ